MMFTAHFAALLAVVPMLMTSVAAQAADAQTSLTLDPAVIAPGFELTGQEVPTEGQAESLTSTNNFINFCKDFLPLTDGQQIGAGSCNPVPMGQIPANTAMPSSKFREPENFGTIQANTAFTVTMAIARMQTGVRVNAQTNFLAAPQQLNGGGTIIGHSNIVIEEIESLTSTVPSNAENFVIFQALGDEGNLLTTEIPNGLPAGVYRLSSINVAANKQPVLVPIAQHGSVDDVIYFTVVDDLAAAAAPVDAAAAAAVRRRAIRSARFQ